MPTPHKTTSQRGYGYRHRQLRETLRPHVEAGETTCWRCRTPILPGTPWDLGHDDTDRTQYRGPEHVTCNRSTAGTRGSQQPTIERNSRNWFT